MRRAYVEAFGLVLGGGALGALIATLVIWLLK